MNRLQKFVELNAQANIGADCICCQRLSPTRADKRSRLRPVAGFNDGDAVLRPGPQVSLSDGHQAGLCASDVMLRSKHADRLAARAVVQDRQMNETPIRPRLRQITVHG